MKVCHVSQLWWVQLKVMAKDVFWMHNWIDLTFVIEVRLKELFDKKEFFVKLVELWIYNLLNPDWYVFVCVGLEDAGIPFGPVEGTL